jgi:hypothetical protein
MMILNRLLYPLSLLCFLASKSAHALPEEVCRIRADLGKSFAIERDRETSKEKVYQKTKKEMGKTFANNAKPYMDLIYSKPDISASNIRMVLYQTCLQE